MRQILRSSLVFLALLAACGGGLPSDPGDTGGGLTWHWPAGLSAATARTSYGTEDAIPAVFHNGSEAAVTVGALDCTAEFERKDGATWRRLSSLRICIQLAVIVPAGHDYPFTVQPPDTGGTYRIVFEALVDGEQLTVRSGEFTVR